MVDTVAPGRLLLRVLSFAAAVIIPPTLHIHHRVNIAFNSDTNTRRLGNLLKTMLFWESESTGGGTSLFCLNNNIFECKWAVTRWQWLLCTYINMK